MLSQDLRYAARYCARRPSFVLLLVITVALGIGATTAVFSVVDALMLRPPPFQDSHRIGELWRASIATAPSGAPVANPGLSPSEADAWREHEDLFERMESYAFLNALLVGDEPTRGERALVTPGLFDMLGAAPARGRGFTPDDAEAGAPDVAILSHDAWHRHFGGREDVVGQPVRLDDGIVTIIGVMPRDFRFPLGGVDLWTPWKSSSVPPALVREIRTYFIVRLREGVPPPVVQSQLDAIARRMNDESPRPNQAMWNVALRMIGDRQPTSDVRTAMWVLAGAVACVLLITCANAANLMLVSASVRRHELAIRNALGATRAHLVRQLLIETLLLSLASGGLGVLLAIWGVEAITGLLPEQILRWGYTPIAIDGRILVFATGLTLLTGLVFGVGPALRATGQGVASSTVQRASSGRDQRRLRSGLIVLEVAASVILLAGAGLLINSYARLVRVDLGMDVTRVLGVEIYRSGERYPDRAERDEFFRRLEERLRSVPGVHALTVASGLPPGSGFYTRTQIEAEGTGQPLAAQPEYLPVVSVDSAYFRTLGIPILRGRPFDARDLEGAAPVAIIDPNLASALWQGESPLGRRFRVTSSAEWLTVVGVAGDVRHMGQDDRYGSYEMYLAASQQPGGASYRAIGLRTGGDPAELVTNVKRAIWEIDPTQPIERIGPIEDAYAGELARPRFLLALMGAFAAAAVVLAMVGIYAVTSYAVAQRTHEIGIRMALGARSTDVLRGVVWSGVMLATIGAAIGLGAAAGLAPLMRQVLYEVQPVDPVTFAAATVVLLAMAVLGCLAPALRASRVEPMMALRSE